MAIPLTLDLPPRSQKPRQQGLTNLVDNGAPLGQMEDFLVGVHHLVDIVKLGWASAYIENRLKEKIALFSRHDIQTCFGGMMFEIAYWQGKTEAYADWLRELGVDMVEVSNGSLPIPEAEKNRMVTHFAKLGFTVLSEVGNKDVTRVSPPEVWVECIGNDLKAGAWKVITEGRADASAGIYRPDGSIQDELMDRILNCGVEHDNLIFEAPHKRQMSWFIHRVGTDANLGNVPPEEVLNLETLRLGLRGDTVNHFHGGYAGEGLR